MLASFLTTIFFSLSVIFGARSARVLGGQTANLARISLATVFLATWAHTFGQGLHGGGLPWFFLSGIVGFGLGDISLFGALPRIGPRLAILITQCLAAPLAAIVEWLWLGTTVTLVDMACGAVILAGVAIALAPDHGTGVTRRTFWIGVLFGIGSALGQASGAVLSRKANEAAALTGWTIDGGTAAYQRVIGGLLTTVIAFLLLRRSRVEDDPLAPDRWKRGAGFVLGNALAGPTLGVGCYQWALRTTPSGLVLPVVATSPLVTIILSFFMDGTRPSRRAVFGGLLAVVGAIALKDAQANWWLFSTVRKLLNI
jgi:drug/metabolite transporter (DMT)-like permease